MKKLILAIVCSIVVISCSKESIDTQVNDQDFTALVTTATDNLSVGTYKGTFTTLDSEKRGTVLIQLNSEGFARATVQLNSGASIALKAESKIELNEDVFVQFSDQRMSFDFAVNANGNNPVISNVKLDSKKSVISILKETTRGPLLPISGTYTCTSCVGHPLLGNGFTQTFNAITVSGDGDNNQNIVTTIILNNKDFGSDTGNSQTNCANSGPDRSCDINGASATISGGRSIIWTGTHLFKRGGSVDCSEVSGTWSFDSQYGLMEGTFVSDTSCVL